MRRDEQKESLRISSCEFERLVAEALDGLPEMFARLLDNVSVEVADEPDVEDLIETGLRPGRDELLGLYRGVPRTERSRFSSALPDQIYIYRGPILRICTTRGEVMQEVRDTLLHELGHHFGLEEGDLPY